MEKRRYDVWAAGDAYERYMGRWSRHVAEDFVAWLACGPGARWLDVGCGTGALTATVADRCRPRTVIGLERSTAFVTSARTTVPTATGFAVADARALPFPEAVFDVAVSGLMLNFLPEPADWVREAARVVRPGGLVAAYVWDYADGMAFLRHFWDAATALDPAAAELDEGRRFPVCRPEPLREMWAAVGLLDVAVAPVEVPTVFADFTDLWEPFLAGQGPAPGYVAALPASARDRLRAALEASVPTRPDGAMELTARAWAVRGRRPVRSRTVPP